MNEKYSSAIFYLEMLTSLQLLIPLLILVIKRGFDVCVLWWLVLSLGMHLLGKLTVNLGIGLSLRVKKSIHFLFFVLRFWDQFFPLIF